MTAESSTLTEEDFEAIQRRVRLVLLLDASRKAGIDPLPTMRLHLIAYLANVLSPVWDMLSLEESRLKRDGSVLKQPSGPFYPDLQTDLDRLVGMGIARVENLRYARLDKDRFRLEGSYRINANMAEPILSCLCTLPDEAETAKYVRELVLALSALSDYEIDRAATQDATYADPTVGFDNVVDFGEWTSRNYSRAAALHAGELVQTGAGAGASEKVHLYIRHLRRRLQGGQ